MASLGTSALYVESLSYIESPYIESPNVKEAKMSFIKMFSALTSYALFTPPISGIPSETTDPMIDSLGGGQQRSTERDNVIARIRVFGNYTEGWNRPDSLAPSRETINDAEKFARSLDLSSIHLPHISAADDGEINFWWDVDGLSVDLGFLGDHSYSFFAKLPDGRKIIVDEAPISQPLPSKLLSYLEKNA